MRKKMLLSSAFHISEIDLTAPGLFNSLPLLGVEADKVVRRQVRLELVDVSSVRKVVFPKPRLRENTVAVNLGPARLSVQKILGVI